MGSCFGLYEQHTHTFGLYEDGKDILTRQSSQTLNDIGILPTGKSYRQDSFCTTNHDATITLHHLKRQHFSKAFWYPPHPIISWHLVTVHTPCYLFRRFNSTPDISFLSEIAPCRKCRRGRCKCNADTPESMV